MMSAAMNIVTDVCYYAKVRILKQITTVAYLQCRDR